MSIFTKITNYFDNRRRTRLWRDLEVLERKIKFEPKYSKIPASFFADDTFTRKTTENLLWYGGNEEALREFFENGSYISKDGSSQNLFWEKAPDDYPMLHSGFPALLSSKQPSILFGNGYEIKVEVLKDNGEDIDEEASAKVQALLDDVFIPKMRLAENLIDGATKESWGGHVFPKISVDTTLSPYPILEMVDIRCGEVVVKRGITLGIIFHEWITKDEGGGRKVQYRLDETYRTATASDFVASLDAPARIRNGEAEIGDAIIEYRLFRMDEKGEAREVALDTIQETADIIKPFFVFEGVNGAMAFSKPNKLPNHDFIDGPYGASDYAHSRSQFDALDEVWSEIRRETRDNKSIVQWPASLLPKDSDTTKPYISKFRTNIVVSALDMREGAKNEPHLFEIADKTESLVAKLNKAIENVCVNAEISPISLGLSDAIGANSSDKTLRERSKATIDLRNKKLSLWKPMLEQMLIRYLEVASWMKAQGFEMPGVDVLDVEFENLNITVTFPDYVSDSETDRVAKIASARGAGVMSIREGVKAYHSQDGWNDDEVEKEVEEIRIDQNLSPQNTETDLLNDLTK